MASQVQIINRALAHLGMNPITNIQSNDQSAIVANQFWEQCRDDVLSEHRWPFANVQIALALVSDEVEGWEYVYGYPAKCARLFNVFNEGNVSTKDIQEFEVVYIATSNKRVVCTNIDEAIGEYTYKVSDTTVWDSKFITAFSYRLASEMAHTLIGDVDKGLKLMQVYNAFLSDAKRLSYQEKIKKPTRTSSAYDAR